MGTLRMGFTFAFVLVAGCVGDNPTSDGGTDSGPAQGSEGGSCFSNGTCNAGLICVVPDLCVKPDAGTDAAPDSSSDASDASDAPTTAYTAFNDASAWASFDLVTNVNAAAKGFRGLAFDGRYVYFVPSDNGNVDGFVVRYDSTATAFTTTSAWSSYDVASNVNSACKGFRGAAFDGQYLYLVPFSNAYGATDGVVTRYDTKASFTAATSWTTFDTTTLNATAKAYSGATFDGQYVYFTPYNSGAPSGLAVRYNTKASFTTGTSWALFDTTTVDSGAKGFDGAVFDGQFVYFVPDDNGAIDGVVARYDTTKTFTASGSWSTYDVAANVDANAKGFHGAAFDGRYIYLIPWYNGAYDGVVAQFDTKATFNASASWKTFDVSTVSSSLKGFQGAAFDGRFMYLVPLYNGASDGVIARFDTSATFTSAASWSSFDLVGLNANAKGFFGGAFDGRYLYLGPNNNGASGLAMRFDAKTPASMPALPAWSGSFF